MLAEQFVPVVRGARMEFFGVFAIRQPGWTRSRSTTPASGSTSGPSAAAACGACARRDLNDESLRREELEARVERFADKTMSDGIAIDSQGTLYLTDLEHDAIVALGQDKTLHTVLKDERLRWPDGLSFGPDGWLYVVVQRARPRDPGRGPEVVRANAPYQIFRFKPGVRACRGTSTH